MNIVRTRIISFKNDFKVTVQKMFARAYTHTHTQIKTQQLIAGLLEMSSEDNASKLSAWSLLAREKEWRRRTRLLTQLMTIICFRG